MSVGRGMHAVRWRVFVLLAASFCLASCSSSGTHGSGAAGTRRIVFDPYSPGGTLLGTIIVTETISGTCVTPGVAGTSSYRCFAQPGSSVHDPCFAPPRATTGPLVCVADPAQPAATRVDVGTLPSEPASGPASGPARRPWAMRLSNGQTCVFVAAAWDGLGPFACRTPASSGASVADCHQPTKARPRWVAECQATEAVSSPFRAMQVVTIWT